MKKLIVIAIALVMVQGVALAQGQHKIDRKDKMHLMHSLTPEEAATLKTKKMTVYLDLNKSQQDEIYKINLENAIKRKEMMADRQAKKANGEIEKPSKEQRLAMMNAKLDHQIAVKAKMKKILNDEQYEKWEKSQFKRKTKAKMAMQQKRSHKR